MMEKKFKFWRFFGALFLPIIIFLILYGVSSIIFIKMFSSFCNMPIMDEFEMNFHLFVIVGIFICQVLVAVIVVNRSKNLFVLIGFCVSTLLTLFPTIGSIKGKVTYKSRMMNMENWKEPYAQDEMAGYFVNHHVFIGKSYKEVVNDLGEPRKCKIEGKYFYEIWQGKWMYELYFENNKCVRQELYCTGYQGSGDYYRENL
jgi:hypothetical protein